MTVDKKSFPGVSLGKEMQGYGSEQVLQGQVSLSGAQKDGEGITLGRNIFPLKTFPLLVVLPCDFLISRPFLKFFG